MPQRVLCDGCGEILYQGYDIKSPEEIYEMYSGRCPKCGRKLSLMPQKIEVLPVRERPGKNQGNAKIF
ncbi:MAG: hypothetical protein QW341_00785 [Candidatus Bathyarchaeia archaeon]